MIPVQVEVHPAVAPKPKLQHWQGLAFECEEHRKVPIEDIDMQALSLRYQGIQETAEFSGQHAPVTLRCKADTTINIPTDDENRFLGLLSRGGKGGKVRCSVNEERDSLGLSDTPAIPSFG